MVHWKPSRLSRSGLALKRLSRACRMGAGHHLAGRSGLEYCWFEPFTVLRGCQMPPLRLFRQMEARQHADRFPQCRRYSDGGDALSALI